MSSSSSISAKKSKTLVQYAHDGKYEKCKRLLEDGASASRADSEGWYVLKVNGRTPLHAASYQGHLQICQLLVANGAKVNAVDNDGWTPFHFAARYGQAAVCEFLIQEGVNVSALTNHNETAEALALKGHYRKIGKIIQAALKKQVYINERRASLESKRMRNRAKIFDAFGYEPSISSTGDDFVHSVLESFPIADSKSKDIPPLSPPPTAKLPPIPLPVAPAIESIPVLTSEPVQLASPPAPQDVDKSKNEDADSLKGLLALIQDKNGQPGQADTASVSTNGAQEKALLEIRQKSIAAHDFWIENFDDATSVPIDRFMFALDIHNDDRVKLPASLSRLREMDLQMFKTLLNSKSMKQLFSDSDVVTIVVSPMKEEAIIKTSEPATPISPHVVAQKSVAMAQQSEAVQKTAEPVQPPKVDNNVLELIKNRNPSAYKFWIDNFLAPEAVSKDLFNLAIQLYNVNEVRVPQIDVPQIDARLFNILCNGPLNELFPTS